MPSLQMDGWFIPHSRWLVGAGMTARKKATYSRKRPHVYSVCGTIAIVPYWIFGYISLTPLPSYSLHFK